jgi:hypothetical protein
LQHFCLPLQQLLVCALTVVAPKNATRLTIIKRYFIILSILNIVLKFGYANFDRAPKHRGLGERDSRRRNGRTLKTCANGIVSETGELDLAHVGEKIVGTVGIKHETGRLR